MGSISWKLCDYRPQVTYSKTQQRRTRNLTKVLFAALKYKKALMTIRKNYIENKKKNTQKEHIRLVANYVNVVVVAKTDDEIMS